MSAFSGSITAIKSVYSGLCRSITLDRWIDRIQRATQLLTRLCLRRQGSCIVILGNKSVYVVDKLF